MDGDKSGISIKDYDVLSKAGEYPDVLPKQKKRSHGPKHVVFVNTANDGAINWHENVNPNDSSQSSKSVLDILVQDPWAGGIYCQTLWR